MFEKTGEVVSVNQARGTARVKYADQDDFISDELPVVAVGGTLWLPSVGDEVFCSFTKQKKGYIVGAVYSNEGLTPS